MTTKAVLTLALGKPLYVEMAKNLARSFRWWHPGSEIQFYLATDRADLVPRDLPGVSLLKVQPGQYGGGFTPKLHVDLITPADRTLFIDADCLCVGNLETVFARFAGHPVGVIGGRISQGEWFGDIAPVCRKLGVDYLPKFNGGIYYVERGPVATQVYSQARELEKDYDALGLVRMRGQTTDELLMAMSLALHQIDAIPDDASILGDPHACPGPFSLDVIKGGSHLINPPAPDPLHRSWYPFERVSPLVVHFLGEAHRTYQYRGEVLRLRMALVHPALGMLATAYTTLCLSWPGQIWERVKPRLRGLYRMLFGVRTMRPADRL